MTNEEAAERVEDLIEQAWDAPTPEDRADLAREALLTDPNAIDAYVVLATCVPTPTENIALLREAVRVGNDAWADALERRESDFFWSDIRTRPFMRAMQSLALALWKQGVHVEAAKVADRLLLLNPNDNQGIRYLAFAWHPVLGGWERVEHLLKEYEGEIRTEYLYTHCLNVFRRGDDCEAILAQAVQINPHVPELLLSDQARSLAQFDEFVSLGSRQEAIAYATHNRAAWESVPLALGWLRGATKDR